MAGIPQGLAENEESDFPLPSFKELFAEHCSTKKRRRRVESNKDKFDGGESAGYEN